MGADEQMYVRASFDLRRKQRLTVASSDEETGLLYGFPTSVRGLGGEAGEA